MGLAHRVGTPKAAQEGGQTLTYVLYGLRPLLQSRYSRADTRRQVYGYIIYIKEMGEGSEDDGQGRHMISLAHSCLWIFGGIASYPREP